MNSKNESVLQRSKRILNILKTKYPGKKSFDLDGRGMHFVSEVEPTQDHPEFDRAIEVIISSKPHKHVNMTQYYTILKGSLELHVGEKTIKLSAGDKYVIEPHNIHWANSDDECWVEILSKPGWTKEDHITVD